MAGIAAHSIGDDEVVFGGRPGRGESQGGASGGACVRYESGVRGGAVSPSCAAGREPGGVSMGDFAEGAVAGAGASGGELSSRLRSDSVEKNRVVRWEATLAGRREFVLRRNEEAQARVPVPQRRMGERTGRGKT